MPEARLEIVSLRCEPTVEVRKFTRKSEAESDAVPPPQSRKPSRLVYFSRNRQPIQANIYNGRLLKSGNVIHGPAVIDLPGTSIVVDENQTVTKTKQGDYIIVP